MASQGRPSDVIWIGQLCTADRMTDVSGNECFLAPAISVPKVRRTIPGMWITAPANPHAAVGTTVGTGLE